MSSDRGPGQDSNQSPSGAGGCLAAFLFALGISSLLPGLCYMALGAGGGSHLAATGVFYALVGVVLMGVAGAMLARRPKQQPKSLWPRPEAPNTAGDAAKKGRPNSPGHGDGKRP